MALHASAAMSTQVPKAIAAPRLSSLPIARASNRRLACAPATAAASAAKAEASALGVAAVSAARAAPRCARCGRRAGAQAGGRRVP